MGITNFPSLSIRFLSFISLPFPFLIFSPFFFVFAYSFILSFKKITFDHLLGGRHQKQLGIHADVRGLLPAPPCTPTAASGAGQACGSPSLPRRTCTRRPARRAARPRSLHCGHHVAPLAPAPVALREKKSIFLARGTSKRGCCGSKGGEGSLLCSSLFSVATRPSRPSQLCKVMGNMVTGTAS